jgi:hypothetical protein
MPINGAVIKTGATGFTVTSGTDKTFSPDGVPVANGIHVADMGQVDARIRASITCKNKPPVLNSDGTWSKDKRSVSFVVPKILASGKTTFPLVRLEIEAHPENTVAERLDLSYMALQILFNSHFASFISTGNLT